MAILDYVGGVDNRPRQAISFATQSVQLVDNTERARRVRTPYLLIRSQKRAVSRYVAMFGQPNLTWANRIVMSPRDAGCITRIDVTTP
jgi:hypothetical protein